MTSVHMKNEEKKQIDSVVQRDEEPIVISDMPWLTLCAIIDKLDVPDMISFICCSKKNKEKFWNDNCFWEKQFMFRFGSFIPSCFKGSWKQAFEITYSRGISYVSKEVTRHALESVCIKTCRFIPLFFIQG